MVHFCTLDIPGRTSTPTDGALPPAQTFGQKLIMAGSPDSTGPEKADVLAHIVARVLAIGATRFQVNDCSRATVVRGFIQTLATRDGIYVRRYQ
jgi:hypothetical protein